MKSDLFCLYRPVALLYHENAGRGNRNRPIARKNRGRHRPLFAKNAFSTKEKTLKPLIYKVSALANNVIADKIVIFDVGGRLKVQIFFNGDFRRKIDCFDESGNLTDHIDESW